MIQPISAFSPRAGFRGSNGTYKNSGITDTQVGLINAGGVAVATGGLMTAIARSHTSSWGSAAVIGLFGSFLALFFMTPQILTKKNNRHLEKKPVIAETKTLMKQDVKAIEKFKCLKPKKIIVPFKQSN